MIEIDSLSVKKKGQTICSAASLKVEPGERVAIRGPNGSGKTTLLRVLAGLETEYEGCVRVEGQLRERTYVHQSPYLLRGTVLFNVTYGLRLRGVPASECARVGRDWGNRLGVGELIEKYVSNLSGGEKRRVALARAMILRPRLLLLDEPLADMDDAGAELLAQAIEELQDSTILIASPTGQSQMLAARDYHLSPARST